MTKNKSRTGGHKKNGKAYGAPKASRMPQDKKSKGKASHAPHAGKTGKSAAREKGLLVEGTIDASGKGFGFLVRDDGGEDMFIPARDMMTALGGDRVVAQVTGNSRGGGEARVVEIKERAHATAVGTYYTEGNAGVVRPDNPRFGNDVYIAAPHAHGARDGQKVVARILDYPPMRRPGGEIAEILGYPDEAGVDELSILRAYDLYEEFPASVLREAKDIPDAVPPQLLEGRKDYRDECIVTIDGDDSRDFDDAVTVSRTSDGLYRLGVHIADVAEYVRAGTPLDAEAYKRGTSVYFPDKVLPMLPEKLCNGICSLNEGVDRLTLSVIMYIDNLGNIVRHKIREGVIRSHARLTYTQVAAMLAGDEALRARYAEVVPMLEQLKVLAELLRNKRTQRGNIEFDIPECKIILDEQGHTKDIVRVTPLVSHKIVEECMLAANETVAEHFVREKAPFVYRAHAAPPPEKVQTLIGFISALGLTFKGNLDAPQSIDFARFLSSLDRSVSGVVNRVALRSMSKATYEPTNIGHFGLAAPYYCHFTSPIRRYPDLMIHRIIKASLHGDSLKKFARVVEDASKQSSAREKVAEAAERKVDDLRKAEFMRGKVGEVYEGIVSGVTEWGIFVELPNTVEGLIRTENLPGSGYVFNAELFRLDSPLRSFRLGDALKIRVDSVVGDRVSFVLATDDSETK